MRTLTALTLLALAGCGGGSTPTSPTPRPAPVPTPAPPPTTVTIRGQITDTVTGAGVGSFTTDASRLPAQVTVSAPGYVTRQTWAQSLTPRVDLFPERGFDLAFYRQLARDDFDRRQGLQPLRVLHQAPSFYMEVEGAKGFSQRVGVRLEAVARRVVPALTGGWFKVARWDTGPTPRSPQPGWIMIERRDEAAVCGRALVGAEAGQIWLDGEGQDKGCSFEGVFAHELGHALGFWHVQRPGSLMFPQARWTQIADTPTDLERHHAALAYARVRGNTDVDVDPLISLAIATRIVAD